MTSRPGARRARAILQLLWLSPLIALPMALFIWFRDASPASQFPRYYAPLVAIVFAGWLSLRLTQFFVIPRVVQEDETGSRAMIVRVAFSLGALLLGATIAGVILNATITPGMLRDARQSALFGMYALLFTTLSLGIGVAAGYYRRVERRARADQELRLARRIQTSFLPTQFPRLPELDLGAFNAPSAHVSGDFYDVVPIGDSALLIAIADVAGKGVPAALLSSMLQASLRTQALSVDSVSSMLGNVNALVYRHAAVEQFTTLFLARLELESRRLIYSNAGHNYPVLFRAGGERVTLERGGPVVGVIEGAVYEEDALTLAPGDRLLLYTDGLTEAANPQGELFGEERLCRLIESLPAGMSCDDVAQRIVRDVRSFSGDAEQADDMTLLVLRMLHGPAA